MRLVYITAAPVPSAAANCVQMLKMCDALAAEGADVTMLTPWHGRRVRSSEERRALEREYALQSGFADRIRYVPYVAVRERFRGSYFFVAPVLAKALRPDVVLTRNARIARNATAVGLDVVLESHSPPGGPREREATRSLCYDRRLLKWVFINRYLRQLVSQEFRIPWDRTAVLHSGADLDLFQPRQPPDTARAALGLPQARKLVVHCGSLYRGRGAEEIVHLAPRLPDVDFLFVGGRAEDIARIRDTAGAPSNVKFVGRVPMSEIPTYLFAADLLVLPSGSRAEAIDGSVHASYSTPLKLLEYLAACRPIVATRSPGVVEVVRHGESAWLVDPDDEDALRAAIEYILASPEVAARLAEGASALAARSSWRQRARQLLETIGASRHDNPREKGARDARDHGNQLV